MIKIFRASERGTTNLDWLDSRHSFSFGHWTDLERMGYRSLRVLNDDRVAGGKGFGVHGHRDMEIISYVLSGELKHEDSMGHGGVINHGEVQVMSAGTGVQHSEWNASEDRPVHFLQIWILPESEGNTPGYQQSSFGEESLRSGWVQIVGGDSGVNIDRDAKLFSTIAEPTEEREVKLESGRGGYLFVARGKVHFHGHDLEEGDSVIVEDEGKLSLKAEIESELLLFDLA